MEQTECSKTSAYKIQMPGNHPEESIQHSEQGKSLKSRISGLFDHWRTQQGEPQPSSPNEAKFQKHRFCGQDANQSFYVIYALA